MTLNLDQTHLLIEMVSSPTEDAKDEVEHEEGSDDDEGDEEDPVESVPKCIVGLQS